MALTKIGAGLFKDTLKSSVSGALGDNATTIRNLTSAGITGSFSPASASISTRLTTAESELSNTLISSSVLSSPSQGTIRLATNGVNTDVDSGLQTSDSVQFSSVQADGGVTVDNITIDGTEIDLSSGDLTVDVAGNIVLDADGAQIRLEDDGTEFGRFSRVSSDLVIKSMGNNNDILFKGIDGSSTITALQLDMSEAGNAIFNNDVTIAGTLTAQEIHTEFTSASIMFSSGSTKFGDTIDDTHEVTGSMTMSGSVTVNDGNLTVTDDLSVDGTTNLDNTDIDGTLTVDGGNIVFNEDSADQDFRVESNGNANMLFVDGGQNAVGIGTNNAGASGEKLLIVGNDNQNFLVVSSSNDDNFISMGTFENDQAIIGFGNKATTPTDLNFYAANRPPIGGSNLVMSLSGSGHVIVPQGPLEVGQHGVAGGQIVSDGDLSIHAGFNDSSTGNGDIIFKRFGESTTAVELARFTSTGRLGIGTASPDARLKVEESTVGANVQIKMRAINDSSAGRTFSITADPDARTVNIGESGNGFFIDSDGTSDKVGIGNVPSPSEPLHVSGSDSGIRIEARSGTRGTLSFVNSSGTVEGKIMSNGNGDLRIGGGSSANDDIIIDNDGLVSFFGNIELNGSGTRQIRFDDGSESEGAIVFDELTDGFIFKVGGTGSAGKKDALQIDSSGHVGIGAAPSNPGGMTKQLELVGTADLQMAMRATSDLSSDARIGELTWITSHGSNPQVASIQGRVANGDEDRGQISFHTRNTDSGGAPPEKMRLTNTGFLGIGCTDPEAMLQVNTGVSDAAISAIAAGIALEFNGNSGGHVGLTVTDGTAGRSNNRGFIGFRGNASGGPGHSHIVFGTAAGTGDAPTEVMRIDVNQKVGIGQTSPSAGKLEVVVTGDGERALQLTNTDSNQTSSDETMRISLTGDTSPTNPRLIGFEDGDSQIGGIVATSGTTVEYSTSSDYRLKENEKAITDGLERVNKLKPYKFNWKTLPDKIVDGFFAHEVAEVVPEAVVGEKDATKIHDRTEREIVDPQLLNVSRLVPILVASVQELSSQVNVLKAQISGSSDFTSLKTAVSGSN